VRGDPDTYEEARWTRTARRTYRGTRRSALRSGHNDAVDATIAREALSDSVNLWDIDGAIRTGDVIDSALEALLAGLDTPGLRELAGATKNEGYWSLSPVVEGVRGARNDGPPRATWRPSRSRPPGPCAGVFLTAAWARGTSRTGQSERLGRRAQVWSCLWSRSKRTSTRATTRAEGGPRSHEVRDEAKALLAL
jgi:hypothetical protein